MFCEKIPLKRYIKCYVVSLLKTTYSYFYYLIIMRSVCNRNKELKGISKGRRCFILGSGPSIKKQNLKLLIDEDVIFLNNFVVHEDFLAISQSHLANKYYMIAPIHKPQSREEWEAWLEELDNKIPTTVTCIFGTNASPINTKKLTDEKRMFKSKNVYWYFPLYEFFRKSKGRDLCNPIAKAEAVSVYALLAAIHLGYDEIYLLGMDHDYFLYDDEASMRMYRDAVHQKNELQRAFGNDFYVEEFYRQYRIFSKYKQLRDDSHVKIFNASAAGVLKVFQRVKYESLFGG